MVRLKYKEKSKAYKKTLNKHKKQINTWQIRYKIQEPDYVKKMFKKVKQNTEGVI